MQVTTFLRSDATATISVCCSSLCGYYLRAVFISLESLQTSMREVSRYVQPLSPAVSSDMNSPSASLGTIVRNYSHTCACASCTRRSCYLRAVFISLGASDCVPTIQGQQLFKGNICSNKYSTYHGLSISLQAHYDDGRRDQRYLRQKVQQLYSGFEVERMQP